MPAQIQGLLNRALDLAKQFTLGQKVVALIGLAVLVLGGVAFTSWVSKPTMAPLYTGLSAQDASAIVDQLTSKGVPYELTDAGSTILVPADKLYAQRLEIAAAGLPTNSDGGGYSLLDNMGMTASEFQQEVTYTRALEGELAKTISAMKGVRTASVKLALPEDSVFVETKGEPSASVFLETVPGVSLSGEQIQSILHLVSASIEDMTPSNVAVIDSNGKVLSEVGGLGTSLQDGKTVEYQQRVAAGIQAMLDRVVGPGNAVVTVHADLDFDQIQRTSETYTNTDGLPPASQSTTVEEYSGTGGVSTGVLGPDNIAVPVGEGSEGQYRSESNVQNNALNKVTEQLVAQPGSVRRQSVSVVVSQDVAASINLAELTTLVAAAAGVDEERGDVVEVSRMPFDTSAAEAAQKALEEARQAEQAAALRQTITTAAIAGVLTVALLVGVLIARRRSRRTEREVVDVVEFDTEPEPEIEEPLPLDERPMDPARARREEIKALAQEAPAEIANGLRSWLASGSSNR